MPGGAADIVIWRNCNIGAPDAETDEQMLSACFVDNGSLDLIRSTDSPASIVVGRTGTGKSATVIRLAQIEANVVRLAPLDLAFRYIENSTVMRFFQEAGVNLDLFYRLLWRHALITELLKKRYQFTDSAAISRWFDTLFGRLKRDSGRERALRYLRKWGDKFWQDTELRMREVAERVESELQSSIEGSTFIGKVSSGGALKLSEEERSEVISRGSTVVNAIQLRELTDLLEFLADEVFNDPQKHFYITLDHLDEDWVGSRIKLKLIRALIEEVKAFRKIRTVKIVVALRQDLLEQVYNETRDGGFQEEKYEAYYARIKWARDDLVELIRKRINEVFRRKYTGTSIDIVDVFPKKRGDLEAVDYIIERTFSRPRDVIAYVNECLAEAEGRPRISWSVLQSAEEKYSKKRLKSLYDEWLQAYPSLRVLTEMLEGIPESFTRSAISSSVIDNAIVRISELNSSDEIISLAESMCSPESHHTHGDFLSASLLLFYHVGIIGVKMSAESPYQWAYQDGESFTRGDMKRAVHFKIHKMFWRALRISRNLSLERMR